ncbi:MAG: 2-aminoethylphosphonate--pyruvate transaminase [Tannerellaceae bacterium]|jgi:2-aminoethylphosphonate-pyruvate transaminase|nr:2-aminoethylphosphonate--pyruvate transaminase [Tannerellaceae bacterium]
MKTAISRPYLLLTPGPLTTSCGVKEAMLHDWCTWDEDYNRLVEDVRRRLLSLPGGDMSRYTTVLMQGSGTFTVESVVGSMMPAKEGKLLVLANGAYGDRIATIARTLRIDTVVQRAKDVEIPDLTLFEQALSRDRSITHVAAVHVETTTGILNPIVAIAEIAKRHDRRLLIDSMSGFGGIGMDISGMDIDYVVSSANKCIQGVPGFGFVIAKRDELAKCEGRARSHSLDLYGQWSQMESGKGKWRFTSPTHVVHAFYQALLELEKEGGIPSREARYRNNCRIVQEGMEGLGFKPVIPRQYQSPIITAFYPPQHPGYHFPRFYQALKRRGFVIYPGKLTEAETFRIGHIGDIHAEDMHQLIKAVEESMYWTK